MVIAEKMTKHFVEYLIIQINKKRATNRFFVK